MHRTTRMLGILMALQAGPATADNLAARFEVSRRTILRDIEQLGLLDVPLVARSGAGGGYALPPWWRFDPPALTATEIETLILALEHLGHGSEAAMPGTEALAAKLWAVVRPDLVRAVADDPSRAAAVTDLRLPESSVVNTVRAAIARGDWLEFVYEGGSGSGARWVKPLSTHIAGGRWYLVAIDGERRAHRHFRLDRMGETRRRLAPVGAEAIEREAEARPAYAAAEHPEVVLRLTERGRLWALDHPDFRRHVVGNEVRFRCPPAEYPYYVREVVRLGREVTLVEPPEARKLLRSTLAELVEHHRDQ